MTNRDELSRLRLRIIDNLVAVYGEGGALTALPGSDGKDLATSELYEQEASENHLRFEAAEWLCKLSHRGEHGLQELARRLGGVPARVARRFNRKWRGASNMTAHALSWVLLVTYGSHAVLDAMADMVDGRSTDNTNTNTKTEDNTMKTETKTNEAKALDVFDELRNEVQRMKDARASAPAIKATFTRQLNKHTASIEALLHTAVANMEAKLEGFDGGAPRAVTIKLGDAPTVDVGIAHKRLPDLVRMLACRLPNGRRLNVWLHGPAGTGKTYAAKKAAEAMGLAFYFTGAVETAYALMGYTDAHGNLVRTPFRDAWENGGVFLMDEADASHPQALAALNAAIDGSLAAFPDGMVERHEDCVIVAGANTVGRGGGTKYAGRVKQDGAFLSRWAMLEWAHDDALETALLGDCAIAHEWVKVVRAMREAAKGERIEGASTTTRATLDGAALLRGGLPFDLTVEATIRKGMDESSWSRLTATTAVEMRDAKKAIEKMVADAGK